MSEVAWRFPGWSSLFASFPLMSMLVMIWLWRDQPDAVNMAAHTGTTFCVVLPSLLLVIPVAAALGINFWLALLAGRVLCR